MSQFKLWVGCTVLAAALLGCGSAEVGGNVAGGVADVGEPISGRKCPDGATVPGIDVSVWQGKVDWKKVAASGQKFAIARVSDGVNYIDDWFPKNWTGIKSAGLIRGAYQYFEPDEDPLKQANIVIKRVGKLGPGDLPVMLDVEATRGKSAATITSRIHTWVNAITQGTGKKPFIYTGAYFWESYVKTDDFASLALNVAWYGTKCPGTPKVWKKWTFHQYSQTGRVSGVSGNVDMNVFNGSLAELRKFAGITSDHDARGTFEKISCSGVKGWSQDIDDPEVSNKVLLSEGKYSTTNAKRWELTAMVKRSDLCDDLGSCKHGFSSDLPHALLDGKPHEIHAYGRNLTSSRLTELKSSPRTITCTGSFEGIKRHIPNMDSYESFEFSSFLDRTVVPQSVVDSLSTGEKWPQTRRVIRAVGESAVYMMDGPLRRHVQNSESYAAWHLSGSEVESISATAMDRILEGAPLPLEPIAIRSPENTATYLIDLIED